MGKIIELTKLCANQIAAGEVVERPASVIKELVENSLDAGAKNIEVRIKDGGLSYMVVQDDGCGMDEGDLELCLKRYATSKLREAADLINIATFGFRGEALPSIASVSRMSIASKEKEVAHGIKVQIEAGRIVDKAKASVSSGTRIEVRDLFYNVPARLKFAKSKRAESQSIQSLLNNFAYIHQDINFRFFNEDKLLLSTNHMDNSSMGRAELLLGSDTAGFLYPFFEKTDYLSIQGFFSAPMVTRRDSRGMHIFVNTRQVMDRKLQSAIKASFRTLLEVGKNPICALNIVIDKEEVDVNVHPRKSEVRFVDERRVMSHIISLLADFLAKTPWLAQDKPTENPYIPNFREGGLQEQSRAQKDTYDFLLGGAKDFPTSLPKMPPVSAFIRPSELLMAKKLLPTRKFADLRVLCQLKNTYLLLESEHGLVAIDQHAAHERVTFEKYRLKDHDYLKPQPLLIPIIVELKAEQIALLHEHAQDLVKLGIEAEVFGEAKAIIRAVPQFMKTQNLDLLLRDLLSELSDLGRSDIALDLYDHAAATIACHSSIRAGQRMMEEEITALLTELDKIDYSAHCPHGRPVVKWFNEDDIKKWFDRT